MVTAWFPALALPSFRYFLLATFLCNAGQSIITLFTLYCFQEAIDSYGMWPGGDALFSSAESATGMFQVATQAGGVLASLLSYFWSSSASWNLKRQALVWLILCTASPISFTFLAPFYIILWVSFVWGMGIAGFNAISYPIISSLLEGETASSSGGAEWSLWIMAVLAPKAIFPSLAGLLLDKLDAYGKHRSRPHLGFTGVFALSTLFMLLAFLSAALMTPKPKHTQHHPTPDNIQTIDVRTINIAPAPSTVGATDTTPLLP